MKGKRKDCTILKNLPITSQCGLYVNILIWKCAEKPTLKSTSINETGLFFIASYLVWDLHANIVCDDIFYKNLNQQMPKDQVVVKTVKTWEKADRSLPDRSNSQLPVPYCSSVSLLCIHTGNPNFCLSTRAKNILIKILYLMAIVVWTSSMALCLCFLSIWSMYKAAHPSSSSSSLRHPFHALFLMKTGSNFTWKKCHGSAGAWSQFTTARAL